MKIKEKLTIKKPKIRRTWRIKPYSRIKPSKKIYDRRRRKKEILKELEENGKNLRN